MLLIINQSKRITRSVSEIFYYMGILSYGATPPEGLSEISELYRAVLILSPEEFPDIADYIRRLKSYKGNIPIFAVCNSESEAKYSNLFDEIYCKPISSAELVDRIMDYFVDEDRPHVGDYRLAGLNASIDQIVTHYYFRPVELTRTETMILRFLMRSYPHPMPVEKILKYAFRHSRKPEPSSIRTHISSINKKFEHQADRRMISSVPGVGYLICTPEFMSVGKIW